MYHIIRNPMGYTVKIHYRGHIYHRFSVATYYDGLRLIQLIGLDIRDRDMYIV